MFVTAKGAYVPFILLRERVVAQRHDWIVYIVDDDDDVRDSTLELLQCVGFAVRDFASGRDFLQQFEPTTGLCIILDLHMPDISGFQVLDALQTRGSTVPIIVFSGRSDHTTQEFGHRSDVIAVVGKPLDADRMIDLIQTLLNAKAAASQPVSWCATPQRPTRR